MSDTYIENRVALFRLPNEVLIPIVRYLVCDDLENVYSTSQRLRRVASNFIEKHRRLKQRYNRVVSVSQLYTGFQTLICDLHQEPEITFYVKNLVINGWAHHWPPRPYSDYRHVRYPKAVLCALKQGIRTRLTLQPDQQESWIKMLKKGDEDPVIALVFLMFPNLESISLRFSRLVAQLSCTQTLLSLSLRLPQCTLFPNLRFVCIWADERNADSQTRALDFARLFVQVSSVKEVTVSGARFFNIGHEERLHRRSNLTDLRMERCRIPSEPLNNLLSHTPFLVTLQLGLFHDDSQSIFEPFTVRYNIERALGDTLQSLKLLVDPMPSESIGSLRGFKCLKILETSIPCLMGRPLDESDQELARYLPSPLFKFTLHVQPYKPLKLGETLLRLCEMNRDWVPDLRFLQLRNACGPTGTEDPSLKLILAGVAIELKRQNIALTVNSSS